MRSYQKIHSIEKDIVKGILDGHIEVEEKLDGSMLRIEIEEGGKINVGSHHVDNIHEADSSFKLGFDNAQYVFRNFEVGIGDRVTIFCEFLSKPKQNTIPYQRVPIHNIIIFDVIQNGRYLNRKEKEEFASRVGLEVAPLLWTGDGKDLTKDVIDSLLTRKSILGHDKGYDRIEGIVIKNYEKYYDFNKYPYLEGNFMCTKIVNDDFKEKNGEENPTSKNQLDELVEMYKGNEPRWRKAIQHLTEKGKIVGEMKDLALLVPEVKKDIEEEDKEAIKEVLWKIISPRILGLSTKGLPEFYKKFLIEKANVIPK